MKYKIVSFAVLAFIALCIYAAFIPENKTTPELFFTEADLDEIQEIADDRTRNYGEILDDISDKIDELKRNARFEADMAEEANREREREINHERQW